MKYINIKVLYLFLLSGLFLMSCGDGLEELNIDPSNPTSVPASSLVTKAEHSLFSRAHGRNLNAEWGKLMTQQWAQNEYCEESRYEVNGGTFNGAFSDIYSNVLNELKVAKGLISEDGTLTEGIKANQIAIIDILSAYAYQTLTDGFGAIPFTQALNPKEYPNPKYDGQDVVYRGIMDLYSNAISNIDLNSPSFGGGEVVYGGDMAAWKKLANSLLLRAAMRVSNKDEGLAKEYLGKVSGDYITSNADNATYTFDSNPSVANPLWIDANSNNRDDFCVSKFMIDHLTSTSDPRLAAYANKTETDEYVGMPYGLLDAAATELKTKTSRPNDVLRGKTTPHVIIDAAQVHFLLAEAYQRGLLSGDAASTYEGGLAASMAYWGVDGSDYISANAYDAGNWQEQLGTQKWLALYHDGYEAWSEWRRIGYPALTVPEAAVLNAVPVRLPYPLDEQTGNGTSLGEVTSTPNDMLTPLWWDAN